MAKFGVGGRQSLYNSRFDDFSGFVGRPPMVALTYIRSVTYMLVAVSLFSASLGFVVAITATKARNQDIFALTAAYAAVLVVFVGNLLQH